MEGSANNTVGSKALNSQTSVLTELWKCSSPLAGCTHHGHRFPQYLRRQFSCPLGCWPHRWGWHGGGLGAGSQPRCKSWRLVPMSFSSPTPWGGGALVSQVTISSSVAPEALHSKVTLHESGIMNNDSTRIWGRGTVSGIRSKKRIEHYICGKHYMSQFSIYYLLKPRLIREPIREVGAFYK